MFVGSPGRRWANCARALSLLLALLAVPALAQYEPRPEQRVEIFGGFSYFRPNGRYLKSDTSKVSSMSGWGSSIYVPFSGNTGGVLDVSGNFNSSGNWHDVMAGAEYKPRKWTIQPFMEGMMGWARRSPKSLQDQGTAAFLVGGGLDVPRGTRFAIRPFRIDYIHSFNNPDASVKNQQTFWNSIRIQSGVVMTFGGAAQEQLVAAVCTATPDTVRVGEPVSAKLTPKGFAHRRSLSYQWELNSAKLGSTAPAAVIETASLAPGNYTVTGKASSSANGKHHQSATCTATFAVLEVPKQQSPAPSEAQGAEPAKAEAHAAPETAKTETQPAPETAAPKSATEDKAANSPVAAENPAAPVADSAAPTSAPQLTASTPAAEKTVATSDAQPSVSAPATASAQVTTPQQAPARNAVATEPAGAAPDAAGTPSTTQSATSQPAPNAEAATEPTAAKPVSTEASAKPATAGPSPATEARRSATPVPPATKATKRSKKQGATSKPANSQPSTNAQASTKAQLATPTEAPNQISVTAKPSTVISGERAIIAVSTNTPATTPPDAICTSDAGTLHPENGKITLDTTGVPAGNVSVTCTDRDGKPLGSTVVEVTQVKPEPQVRKLNPARFNDAKRPAHIDEAAKQTLRDAARTLQQSAPGSKLIIVGNARSTEMKSRKDLPERRANSAREFLTDKQNGAGVDASSIVTYRGKANARRVDIYIAAPGVAFNPDKNDSPSKAQGKGKQQDVRTPELRWHGIVEK
jgi:hypothetical protein